LVFNIARIPKSSKFQALNATPELRLHQNMEKKKKEKKKIRKAAEEHVRKLQAKEMEQRMGVDIFTSYVRTSGGVLCAFSTRAPGDFCSVKGGEIRGLFSRLECEDKPQPSGSTNNAVTPSPDARRGEAENDEPEAGAARHRRGLFRRD
jgi:hypothetical protein